MHFQEVIMIKKHIVKFPKTEHFNPNRIETNMLFQIVDNYLRILSTYSNDVD